MNRAVGPIQCDVCGQYISYADLQSGKARRAMITPDAEGVGEAYETTCRKHTKTLGKQLLRLAGTQDIIWGPVEHSTVPQARTGGSLLVGAN